MIFELLCCQQVMKSQVQLTKTWDSLHNLSTASIAVSQFSRQYHQTKIGRKDN